MPPPTLKPCSFYLTNSCKKGINCPFLHGQQPSPRSICHHYSRGSCLFGERCKNLHEQLPCEIKPCVFWKAGKCSKGDQCKFLHEPLSMPSDSGSWRGQESNQNTPSIGRKLAVDRLAAVATCKEVRLMTYPSSTPVQCTQHRPPTRMTSVIWMLKDNVATLKSHCITRSGQLQVRTIDTTAD